jgi:hypothetical protein
VQVLTAVQTESLARSMRHRVAVQLLYALYIRIPIHGWRRPSDQFSLSVRSTLGHSFIEINFIHLLDPKVEPHVHHEFLDMLFTVDMRTDCVHVHQVMWSEPQ